MTLAPQPYASLSLDLDNKWSYLRTHGGDTWASYPTYLPEIVPRIIDVLAELELRITFFIVGRDAEDPRHADAFRTMAAAGHEVASHSYMHQAWLHLLSRDELIEDFVRAEDAITAATGRRPTGFRGPGFSISRTHLEVLADRGYRYDATVFPNLLNPLARAYFFAHSNLNAEERKQREGLFGTWSDAFRPLKPFEWNLGARRLLEIPVSTMPIIRAPIHFSYVLYLAGFSPALARAYFRTALRVARWTGVAPSLLLHPLDFMGREDDQDLAFFPGMAQPRATKLLNLRALLQILKSDARVITMGEHADLANDLRSKRVLEPVFAVDAGKH